MSEITSLIDKCIKEEIFKPLTFFEPNIIKDYINIYYYYHKPSNIKNCMKYFNMVNIDINNVYEFLDGMFENLRKVKADYPIIHPSDLVLDFYYFLKDDKKIFAYNYNDNTFTYSYKLIYRKLKYHFNLNDNQIFFIMKNYAEEKLNTEISTVKFSKF